MLQIVECLMWFWPRRASWLLVGAGCSSHGCFGFKKELVVFRGVLIAHLKYVVVFSYVAESFGRIVWGLSHKLL